MTWVTPRTWAPEEFVTALMMQGISDALSETAPAKASVANELFRSVAQNSIEAFGPGNAGDFLQVDDDGVPQLSPLAIDWDYVEAQVTTSSATYVGLTGGPSVTVTPKASGNIELRGSLQMRNNTIACFAIATVHDGTSTRESSIFASHSAQVAASNSDSHPLSGILTGFTPGVPVTLTMRYAQSGGGQGAFQCRYLLGMAI